MEDFLFYGHHDVSRFTRDGELEPEVIEDTLVYHKLRRIIYEPSINDFFFGGWFDQPYGFQLHGYYEWDNIGEPFGCPCNEDPFMFQKSVVPSAEYQTKLFISKTIWQRCMPTINSFHILDYASDIYYEYDRFRITTLPILEEQLSDLPLPDKLIISLKDFLRRMALEYIHWLRVKKWRIKPYVSKTDLTTLKFASFGRLDLHGRADFYLGERNDLGITSDIRFFPKKEPPTKQTVVYERDSVYNFPSKFMKFDVNFIEKNTNMFLIYLMRAASPSMRSELLTKHLTGDENEADFMCIVFSHLDHNEQKRAIGLFGYEILLTLYTDLVRRVNYLPTLVYFMKRFYIKDHILAELLIFHVKEIVRDIDYNANRNFIATILRYMPRKMKKKFCVDVRKQQYLPAYLFITLDNGNKLEVFSLILSYFFNDKKADWHYKRYLRCKWDEDCPLCPKSVGVNILEEVEKILFPKERLYDYKSTF